VEGILRVHRDGFGFVHPLNDEGEDIYLPRREAQRALDNDLVLVREEVRNGRTQGRLLKILERRRRNVIGIYFERGKGAYVLPRDPAIPGPIRVPRTQLARDGDLVKVRLLSPERAQGVPLSGEVAGSLGKPGDPSVEVLSIAFAEGFSDEFPAEVMDEAAAVRPSVGPEDLTPDRRDLRGLPLVTIDGEDARDFDDAVCAEPHGDGWRLVVAIADVAHYVREGAPIDAEAFLRGTSVYLPNRVLPMLPERLSNGICSLVPAEDRLCRVADMIFDRGARMRSFELYPGVMRSAARCTYNEVQAVLDGKDVPHRSELREHFQHLRQLARALTRMREARGAIDFDLPERKVVLDDAGNPVRIERRERLESHRIVEECMLAANEAVAKFFQDRRIPTIYRYHGEPDEEKLAAFAALANAHGFRLGTRGKVSSHDLNLFLEKLEGHAEQRALNQLLLRSMMQAVYTAEEVGHYGLGAEHYLHFTSPIRRYPDLIVHRQLQKHGPGRRPPSEAKESEVERLQRIAVHCSERERAAIQVEREVTAFYSALLMKDRIGEEFTATVSSLVEFGFFVELDDPWVEGLVKADSLGAGFRFDREKQLITYASGLKVRAGQRLVVRLVSVNLQRRQLDFEVVRFEKTSGKAAPQQVQPQARASEHH